MTRILKLSLTLLKSHAIMRQSLDPAAATALDQLLQIYVRSWQVAETKRKEKEAEKESLYKYKDRKHGDGSTEEQRDQREIQQLFPTFQQVRPIALWRMCLRATIESVLCRILLTLLSPLWSPLRQHHLMERWTKRRGMGWRLPSIWKKCGISAACTSSSIPS